MQGNSILLLALDENGVARPVRIDSVTGRIITNEADDSAWEGAGYVTWQTEASLSNEKVLGTDIIMAGTLAARPAASLSGRLYFATDNSIMYRDTGAAWQTIAGSPAPTVATTLASGAVSVGTTVGGTQIVAARADRKRVIIQGSEVMIVYIGISGVTTGTGYPLVGFSGAYPPAITLETTAAVFGIVASGSQSVRFIEEYGS